MTADKPKFDPNKPYAKVYGGRNAKEAYNQDGIFYTADGKFVREDPSRKARLEREAKIEAAKAKQAAAKKKAVKVRKMLDEDVDDLRAENKRENAAVRRAEENLE